ncbi:MAG: zinc-binding dehydrogenase, partial [Gemmatimonadota bacterium]
MKQVLHHLATGAIALADVPAPLVGPRQVLIANQASVISAGTERMLVAFGRANWLERARQQPDRVRQVLDKARTDGVAATARAVRARLDAPLALGYSSAGIVLDAGREVTGIAIGDRVVSNGAHAELVAVSQTLCARIPDGVAFDAAAYTVIAAIGLQGVRLAAPELGEAVVVSGLGVIGLLTVQILVSAGCRVAGIDPLPERLALAARFGATPIPPGDGDPVERVLEWTRGRGADAVLVAAATESSEPVRQAARMSRKRGRVVLIGAAGTALERTVFYERELSFQVSCSYGPGRYDPQYEEAGYDYPLGYVRWTEQRNFEAIVELMAAGRIDPAPLTTHRYPQAAAEAAYDVILGAEPSLGVVLEYPPPAAGAALQRLSVSAAGTTEPRREAAAGSPGAAVLGAGNFAGQVLVPAIAAAGARLVEIVSARGTSAAHLASRHGFARCATDVTGTLAASDVDAVFIATRHDSHAALAAAALAAGKSVYVEKPLALSLVELETVRAAWTAASAGSGAQLM